MEDTTNAASSPSRSTRIIETTAGCSCITRLPCNRGRRPAGAATAMSCSRHTPPFGHLSASGTTQWHHGWTRNDTNENPHIADQYCDSPNGGTRPPDAFQDARIGKTRPEAAFHPGNCIAPPPEETLTSGYPRLSRNDAMECRVAACRRTVPRARRSVGVETDAHPLPGNSSDFPKCGRGFTPRHDLHCGAATSGRKAPPTPQSVSSRPTQNAFCGLGLHRSGLSGVVRLASSKPGEGGCAGVWFRAIAASTP